MSNATASAETFASGRYSKRKRTQITYRMDELDVSDADSDIETPHVKKLKAKTTSEPSHKTLPKRKVFPFMELPAEIRNIIYGYTLTDPMGINLAATFEHKRRTTKRIPSKLQKTMSGLYYRNADSGEVLQEEEPVPLTPSLLAVSKQIYREAIDILYGHEFTFFDSFALYAFMINLGATGAKHVKKIKLGGWLDGRGTRGYNHCCFAALMSATNLTSFHIETSRAGYSSTVSTADQLYRDAFPWLESMAAAKGKMDAGVDVLKFGDAFFGRSWSCLPLMQPLSKEENVDLFKNELRKLLGAQQQIVMGNALVKKKKKKAGKSTDAEE